MEVISYTSAPPSERIKIERYLKKQKEREQINKPKLVSVEENIILWKEKTDVYFYTDIKQNELFDGKRFALATPFSDCCALVKNDDWEIINIDEQERIILPRSLNFENIKGIRHNNISILDRHAKKWGSYYFDAKNHSFTQKIPFIWDALEFSRKEGIIYGGISKIYKSMPTDNMIQNKGDWWLWDIEIPLIAMTIEEGQTEEYYQEYLGHYKNDQLGEHIKYIKETHGQVLDEKVIKELAQYLTANLTDIADFEFGDEEKYNHNSGEETEVGDFKTYKKVLGKMKEQ